MDRKSLFPPPKFRPPTSAHPSTNPTSQTFWRRCDNHSQCLLLHKLALHLGFDKQKLKICFRSLCRRHVVSLTVVIFCGNLDPVATESIIRCTFSNTSRMGKLHVFKHFAQCQTAHFHILCHHASSLAHRGGDRPSADPTPSGSRSAETAATSAKSASWHNSNLALHRRIY